MLISSEPVHFHCPTLEAGLNLDDLLSIFHSQNRDSLGSPSGSGSEEGSSRAVYSVAERKRRRMISNRESARRSRWRKKRHLENLTAELNRLNQLNRSLKSRLELAARHCHVAWTENDRLSLEFLALRSTLSELHRNLGH